jgi:hypothetical protein
MKNRGSISGQGQGICLFSTTARPALQPIQPPIQWVPWPDFPGVQWPGHEADHSPPHRAEGNNEWRYTYLRPPTPHHDD